VITTIHELGEDGIVLRSLREGIDTSNPTGRMVAGVLASLAELELELGRERRTMAREARRARGQAIGRPKALDASKAALAQRMHASGESAGTIAGALGVSRATVYRALAESDGTDQGGAAEADLVPGHQPKCGEPVSESTDHSSMCRSVRRNVQSFRPPMS
jgi:DNA invertase Pin-like site-specific DNA recombinase